MGANILKGPIMDKIVFDKKTSDFKIGVCEMQGWRKTMEDSSIAHIHFDKNHSLFGIMDGHGGKNRIIKHTIYIYILGSLISKFVAFNFKKVLTNMNSYKQKNYEQALIETFLKLDEYLKNYKVNRFLYKLSDQYNMDDYEDLNTTNSVSTNGNGNDFTLQYHNKVIDLQKHNSIQEEEDMDNIQIAKLMGTTANIILMNSTTLYVANVGDSLSVMYKNGKAIKLNQEHKTTLKSEYERIAKSGAQIINNRIEGKLNLTRAIGDLIFKSNPILKSYEQSVTVYPEIIKIKRTDDIEFIIMGCDGLWDCVEPQQLCENISKRIKAEPNLPLSKIISAIFDLIISKSNNGK